MASFRSEAEAFSGMSGMAEGHDRYARGLKPRALARGVGSFITNPPLLIMRSYYCYNVIIKHGLLIVLKLANTR